MTEELSYHHMPLQKQSTSTLLFLGSQTRGDCCDHLVCFPYYTGNSFFPRSWVKACLSESCPSLKPPSTRKLLCPQDRQRCLWWQWNYTLLQGWTCLTPASSHCILWYIFACRMEKPHVCRQFCLQVGAAGDLSTFLSNKMTGLCSAQPPTMIFICLPCQKIFSTFSSTRAARGGITGCHVWVTALPGVGQALVPEICSITTGVTPIVFPLKSMNKFAFILKSSILIPHTTSF